MELSTKWQKFYKWYCVVSCLLVGLVYIFTLLVDTGWGAQHQCLYCTARKISFTLFAATITGVDILLWLISIDVWFHQRQSTRLRPILGWGLAMLPAKFLNCAAYVALTDNIT